jgi:hypothetical protein
VSAQGTDEANPFANGTNVVRYGVENGWRWLIFEFAQPGRLL